MGMGVNFYGIAFCELAGQKLGRQWVLQPLLNRPFKGSGAKSSVMTFVYNPVPSRIGKSNIYLSFLEPVSEVVELDIDDFFEVFF